LKQDTNTTKS